MAHESSGDGLTISEGWPRPGGASSPGSHSQERSRCGLFDPPWWWRAERSRAADGDAGLLHRSLDLLEYLTRHLLEEEMLLSPSALLLLLPLSQPVSESVPRLNVEPSCRAATKVGQNLDASLQTCMKDENTAHAELEGSWARFPMADRQRCVAFATQVTASYVELLECLKTAREAKQIEQQK